MVTINAIQCHRFNGAVTPVMHEHKLRCKKAAPTFDVDQTVTCYIMRYLDDRYAVFSSSGFNPSKYHVFESLKILYEHFDEL